MLAKYLLLDPVKDAADLKDAYNSMVVNNLLSDPVPSMPGIQTLLDNLKAANPDAAQFTPQQAVDLTILTELRTSGFISSLSK